MPDYVSMPRYPHTKLFSNPRCIVVLSGPHIQLLDPDGCILFSTAKLAPENAEGVVKSGPIRCSGMSEDGRYLATTGDDKILKIWDLESLTLSSAQALPKKPTSIEFCRNTDILVSDKFGDVFRYTLHPSKKLFEEGDIGSHENPFNGELILGHASLLTSCLLTPDEKFIITADRDEHIRISRYPEGYIIESYCLGHKEYVSAIHIPAASPANLISGGGDPELKVWDWITGGLQRNIAVFAAVKPFIRVTVQSRRQASLAGNSDDDEVVKPRGRKDDTEDEGQLNVVNLSEDTQGQERLEGSNKIPNTKATVFVVRKISSFVFKGEIHVLFSVVGATAIFEFVLAETDDQPDIRYHDFGKPVIDFTVCAEGIVWVLLDADFREQFDVPDEHLHPLVRVIQWSANQFTDAGSSRLLDSLNTICSLPVGAEDLKALDLYSDLSSLPKNIDTEQGSYVSKDELTGEGTSAAPSLTKRALGRLKHKRALDQLHSERVGSRDMSHSDTKKMRVDPDIEDSHST